MKLKHTLEITADTNVFFMSDLHYGHTNILTIDKRPYESIVAMNSYIVRELKTKLRPTDIVFDLGDLFWKSTNIKECREVLDSIPSQDLYKVLGNHDPWKRYIPSPTNSLYDRFKVVADILDIGIRYESKDYLLTLSHYPILDWNHMYRGSLHLYGHTHGHTDSWVARGSRLMLDVGFSASLAKEYGSFLIPFSRIIQHFRDKTGGMDFKDWADIEYHKPSMWNEKE